MEEVPRGSFQDELDWCTQQLRTGLLTETNPQEVEGRQKLLYFLQSKGPPSARKRQVMQMVFGDYRQRMTNEQMAQEEMGLEMRGSGVAVRETLSQRNREGTFAWIPSNNSFNFNFFPDGDPASAGATEETSGSGIAPLTEERSGSGIAPLTEERSGSGIAPLTEERSGSGIAPLTEETSGSGIAPLTEGSAFAFNFQIPEEKPSETVSEPSESVGPHAAPGDRGASGDGGSDQTAVCPPHRDKKKKKGNKKKNSAGAADHRKKQPVESSGSAASRTAEADSQSAELQLARELDWCAEQLELGLRTQKSSSKQMEEASRALKTLRSNKAPLVKKRQVMRAMFGDYRKKMAEDKAKQVKLMLAAAKLARITAVSEPAKKPVFRRRAECNSEAQPQKPDTPSQAGRPGPSTENFVFAPTPEEFCFNFF